MFGVLFVCTGNICRSPTAEAVFAHKLREEGLSGHFLVDSAGTHGYHVGAPPDSRSIMIARERGVMMEGQLARKVEAGDFKRFNLILAMDHGHYMDLLRCAPSGHSSEVRLFLDDHPEHKGDSVPDPYYGDDKGFGSVFDLIEQGADGLLKRLKTELEL